jgi:SNF2 family DNA or RNA helicase
VTIATEPAATFWVVDGFIRVTSLYEHRDRCKAVPGGSWSPETRTWQWPATVFAAKALASSFKGAGKVRYDDDFKRLMTMTEVHISEDETVWDGPDPLTPLWQHQQDAIAHVINKKGGYLAHDMGAGKTLSAIAIALKRRHNRILVLCPKRVVRQWGEQLDMHTGGMILPVPLIGGDAIRKVRTAKAALDSVQGFEPVAIIVNYESAISKALKEWILKQHWDLVILDESHRIKAPGGVTSLFCKTLAKRAAWRLCLSGTPFAHGPLDIYGQMRFLDPTIFGNSFALFKATYAIYGGFQNKQVIDYRNLDDLHQRFYAVAHRVETRDVIDLPEERDIEVIGELGPQAKKHYVEMARDFITWVESSPDNEPVTAANAMTKLMRLQQITSGYLPGEDRHAIQIDTAKMALLEDLLLDLPADEPVVIFARFHHDLDSIREVAGRLSRSYGEISGRRDDYDLWEQSLVNTIGIQLQAGAEGLNKLVSARYAVYYSVDFSLYRYNQSRARIVRPGQKRSVTFYHLVMDKTVDKKVYRSLAAREEVVDSILKGRVLE